MFLLLKMNVCGRYFMFCVGQLKIGHHFVLRLVSTCGECDKKYFAWNDNNSHHLCGHYSVFMSVPIILRFVCLYLFICDHYFLCCVYILFHAQACLWCATTSILHGTLSTIVLKS